MEAGLPPGAWLQQATASTFVDSAGHLATKFVVVCSSPVATPCPLTLQAIHDAGLLQGAWYQPADRFWTFQGIEAAIFVALAMALTLLAARLLGRRQRKRS